MTHQNLKLGHTQIIYIKEGTTLKEARELMKEKRIRHLPVVNAEGTILGVLSSHDMLEVARFETLPVELFISTPVQYVTESTSLKKVAFLMLEKKISSVILTDENKNVLGIITTDDLLYQLTQILSDDDDSKTHLAFPEVSILVTAGEFFRSLSNIGI